MYTNKWTVYSWFKLAIFYQFNLRNRFLSSLFKSDNSIRLRKLRRLNFQKIVRNEVFNNLFAAKDLEIQYNRAHQLYSIKSVDRLLTHYNFCDFNNWRNKIRAYIQIQFLLLKLSILEIIKWQKLNKFSWFRRLWDGVVLGLEQTKHERISECGIWWGRGCFFSNLSYFNSLLAEFPFGSVEIRFIDHKRLLKSQKNNNKSITSYSYLFYTLSYIVLFGKKYITNK